MKSLFEIIFARRLPQLIFLAALILCAGINSYSLRGSTEPREAGIAAEMLQDSQYVVPKLNSEPFLEKPPLSYWLQAAALKIFGYQPATVRLPSIIASMACLCALFISLKKLYGRDIAWLGGMLLLTMASFWMNARTAGQDALLMFGVALALFGFNAARADSSIAWLIYSSGIAVAVLTKGVVGLAVPGVVIFAFLVSEICFIERRFIWSHWWRPAFFALLGILPFVLWLVLLNEREGSAALKQLLWSNSVDRFTGDYQFGSHSEPFYYYLQKLPETFAPWNLLLFVACWQMRDLFKQNNNEQSKNALFFCCWLLAPYVLLSFSSGKRPSYLLMIYPAAAALLAMFAARVQQALLEKKPSAKASWLVIVQGVLLSAIALFAIWRVWHLHARAGAVVLAIILIALIVMLWRAYQSKQWQRWAASGVLMMTAIYTVYGGAALKHEKRQDSPEAIFAQMRMLQEQGYDLALYGPIERIAGAANFYLQRSLPELNDANALQQLLDANQRTAVLIADTDLAGAKNYRVIVDSLDQKRKYLIITGAAATK